MPNPFPIHGVSLGAAAASQLMQSVNVPALTLQLPTLTNLRKLSAADKKTVAIAAGIGSVAAYALGRRAWVAVLGALGGAVYGMYRTGSAATAAPSLPPATTAQFVDAAILSKSPPPAPPLPALPAAQSPVTAGPPAPPPGAASAPAAEPPAPPPADPAAGPVDEGS